jgi:hypothetical protein
MCNVWGIARINSLPMVLDVICEDEELVMMMTFGGGVGFSLYLLRQRVT